MRSASLVGYLLLAGCAHVTPSSAEPSAPSLAAFLADVGEGRSTLASRVAPPGLVIIRAGLVSNEVEGARVFDAERVCGAALDARLVALTEHLALTLQLGDNPIDCTASQCVERILMEDDAERTFQFAVREGRATLLAVMLRDPLAADILEPEATTWAARALASLDAAPCGSVVRRDE